jgi:hypothetical protein
MTGDNTLTNQRQDDDITVRNGSYEHTSQMVFFGKHFPVQTNLISRKVAH